MISFKEFLLEDETHYIGEHKLNIFFTPNYRGSKKTNHYRVDFNLGRSYQKNQKTPLIHAMNILKTVQNSIHNFVDKKKPDSLTFVLDDEKRLPLYHKVSQDVAKKHGGVWGTTNMGFPIVVFKGSPEELNFVPNRTSVS